VIIVPLAGEGSRFKEVGIFQPKWSLQVGNESILSRAIQSILNSRNINERIVLGCLAEQVEFVSQVLSIGVLNQISLVTLDYSTKGQAETVLRILEKIQVNESERLIIWCGDSAFRSEAFEFGSKAGNWLLVSDLPGEHWSFVREYDGEVIEVAEKSRISNHASVGLYAFETVQVFLDTKPLDLRLGYKESFISPLYNSLIIKKRKIEMYAIDAHDYYPFGTPKEILETSKRMNWIPPAELNHLAL
jgi:choline kinase